MVVSLVAERRLPVLARGARLPIAAPQWDGLGGAEEALGGAQRAHMVLGLCADGDSAASLPKKRRELVMATQVRRRRRRAQLLP